MFSREARTSESSQKNKLSESLKLKKIIIIPYLLYGRVLESAETRDYSLLWLGNEIKVSGC